MRGDDRVCLSPQRFRMLRPGALFRSQRGHCIEIIRRDVHVAIINSQAGARFLGGNLGVRGAATESSADHAAGILTRFAQTGPFLKTLSRANPSLSAMSFSHKSVCSAKTVPPIEFWA